MEKESKLSPLELLTSNERSVLWIIEKSEFFPNGRKEIFGVNHANWKIPRRGFHFSNANYFIDRENKILTKEYAECNHKIMKEFDKIGGSNAYLTKDSPEEIFQSFLHNGYKIIEG